MISPLSSEYLTVRFFIKFLAFAPVSGPDYSNAVAAPGKTHCQNPALTAPNAKQTWFPFAVRVVYGDDSEGIEKGALRFYEGDPMF